MKKIALFLLTCCMFLTCCACQGQQQPQTNNSTSANTSPADAVPSQGTEEVPASIEDELSPTLTEADKANIPIEMARNNIYVFPYQIKDGWIYGACLNNAGDLVFGKRRVEESEWSILNPCQPESMAFYKEYIYVTFREDGKRSIYRMSLGGSKLTKLVDGYVQYLQIKNDRVYYCKYNDADQNIYYSCDMDGSNEQVEINKNIYYPYTPDGNIFFYQDDKDDESIHIYNKQTQDDKRITSAHAYAPIYDGKHHLYYIQNDNPVKTGDGIANLVSCDLDTLQETVLYEGVYTGDLALINDSLYFVNTNDEYRLYSIDIHGENIKLVTDEPNSSQPIYTGDKLIYTVFENRDKNTLDNIYYASIDGSNKFSLYNW